MKKWCDSGFIENIILINRGYTAPEVQGLKYYHLPLFNYEEEALFSIQLQYICDQFNADLFISTYYTTPLFTPSILMIHDMIPEVIGLDLKEFWWREKHYSILYASRYITVSRNTTEDLIKFFPEIEPSQISTIYNGVDNIFFPASPSEITATEDNFAIGSPYVLLVGSRLSLNNYKNATILFKALNESEELQQLTIVCVGGEKTLEPQLADLCGNINICLIQPTDWELRAIYSGAIALVYPSLYEGFGLPILEAMACGCPVITCSNSSLPEVGGDAAIYINGQDVGEMVEALKKVQNKAIRHQLIEKGKKQAKKFSWSTAADKISSLCLKTIDEGKNRPKKFNFMGLWQDFRQTQVQERKYRLLAGEINQKNIELHQAIAQLEGEHRNLTEQIEQQNQLIAQLESRNQALQVDLDHYSLQIEELSNTKKTLKRLCKKALGKLLRFRIN
nr:glycosyltransferase [Synechocystis sp. PCC 6714]